jgi:hypothetical protein
VLPLELHAVSASFFLALIVEVEYTSPFTEHSQVQSFLQEANVIAAKAASMTKGVSFFMLFVFKFASKNSPQKRKTKLFGLFF